MKKNKKINRERNKKEPNDKLIINSKNQISLLVILFLITFIVFSNTLANQLVDWDDFEYIRDNPYIKNISLKGIVNIFTSLYYYNYHPLTTLSWAIEYKLFGQNLFVFHLDNIFLHLINVTLVFYLIKKLSKRFDVSAIVAALFAIHPMHVESVAWISERKDLLYALFYLSALLFYVNYLELGYKKKHLWLSLLFFIFSLLAKSMAITLPAILLLFDYYLKREFNRKLFYEKIPFALLAILFIWLTLYSQFYQYSDVAKTHNEIDITIIDKLLLPIYGILFYLFKLILPINLSALHPYPLKSNGYLPIIFYIAPFILSLLVLLVIKIKMYRRELIFGFLFFIFSISIVLQFVPIGHAVVAERYTYIPYLGLFFLIGSFYQLIQEKIKNKTGKQSTLIISFLIILLIVLSIGSFNRNKVWKNTKSLFTDVSEKYPNHYFSYFSLGNYESNLGNYEKAVLYYEKSISLYKKDETLFNNYALLKYKMNDFNSALDFFNEALKLNNAYNEAYVNRGNVFLATKQYDNAILDFSFVINNQKKGTDKYQAYYNRGIAYFNLNDYKNAILNYDIAIAINPEPYKFYNNRALTKLKIDDVNGAINDYSKAIFLNNNDVQLYFNRAVAYTKQNNLVKALQDYNTCIQMKGDYYEAFFNRGNIYFSLSKYNESINDFSKAIEINPNYISFFINRGNAFLKLGNVSNACNDWKQAKTMGNLQINDLFSKHCK